MRARRAEHGGRGVGVRVEVDEADRPVALGDRAHVGLRDRVVAAEDHGDRSGGHDRTDRAPDRGVRRIGVGRHDGGIAEVDHVERCEGVDPGGQMTAGWGARRADRARGEARPGPVRDELVGGRADDRHVDADQVIGVLGVGLAREAQQAREVGLLPMLGPAQQRVDHASGR